MTHQQPPIPKYALHRMRAEDGLDKLSSLQYDDTASATALVLQVHATLALVDLLRELRDDLHDLRRDVSRLSTR